MDYSGIEVGCTIILGYGVGEIGVQMIPCSGKAVLSPS